MPAFYWPPRPTTPIDPSRLGQLEAENVYGVQFKMNGSGSVVTANQGEPIHVMSRHRTAHKAWKPSDHTAHAFRHLKGNYTFWAELMHSKVSGGPRDTLYINDIGVADGKILVGTTFAYRQQLLQKLFDVAHRPVSASGGYWIIDDHTWLARIHTSGFLKLFQTMAVNPKFELGAEGLVLKRMAATLQFPGHEKANVTWMLKSRLPTKGFNH